MDETSASELAPTPRPRRRWMGILILLASVVIVIGLLPRIAAMTTFRDVILKQFLKDWPGEATAASATLGWFTPVTFTDIRLTSRGADTIIHIPRFAAEAPLWRFVFAKQDLGLIRIVSPSAEVVVLRSDQSEIPIPETKEVSDSAKERQPVGVNIQVENLTVRLRGTEEVDWTTIEKIDLGVALGISPMGEQTLTVTPGVILDHVQITPIMGEAGLKFIAPVLADLAWAKGQFSLELDVCELNLARPESGALKGRLAIHSIEAGGRNAILKEIGQFLMTLFPKQMPNAIRFVDHSVIEFEMVDAGIRHDGLAFGLPAVAPDLVMKLDGWVGFDQRLDLMAEVPVPVHLFAADPAATPGGESFEIPIGGTLSEPKADIAAGGRSGMQMVDRLLDRIPEENQVGQQAAEILRSIGAAMKQRAENNPDAPPLGQKIIENGLPKVGRFAEQVLSGQKRKQLQNANGNGNGAVDRKDEKQPKRGLLKGLFQKNREKRQRQRDNAPPAPAPAPETPTGPI